MPATSHIVSSGVQIRTNERRSEILQLVGLLAQARSGTGEFAARSVTSDLPGCAIDADALDRAIGGVICRPPYFEREQETDGPTTEVEDSEKTLFVAN